MKYLWVLLPVLSIWTVFGIHEALGLHLADNYEYIGGTYMLEYEGEWYGFPYVVTSLLLIAGSTIFSIFKVSE